MTSLLANNEIKIKNNNNDDIKIKIKCKIQCILNRQNKIIHGSYNLFQFIFKQFTQLVGHRLRMGPVRRSKKPSPDGWEMIEPTIDDLNKKMREAETDPHEGKRKVEAEWPIFRIHHKRSRYIYDLYYKRKVISKVGALLFF